MKLAESTNTLVCSQDFVETEFSIGDPILIMEYLRKNAYSNPKRAICQEIMSNARDAHREVGVANMPIVVKLPNRMQPVWSCRDYGPGISPSRMSDVFTKFGKSTKRDDNNQTGGFGIGAKTPWAYTDTFLITTICNIEGNLIKYQYAAVIGANRVPKLIQMAEPCRSDEKHTGTTISFNVEAKDHYEFSRYSFEVSSFWTVRPEISGGDDYKHLWEIGGYKFKYDTWGILSEGRGNTQILIDGIPYSLNVDSLGETISDAEKTFIRYNTCHFFFNVGELSVSLNREALYYDDRTNKRISGRVREAINTVRVFYEQEVANSKTLWDAAIALKVATGFFNDSASFLKGIQWNGKIIPQQVISGCGHTTEIIHYKREAADSYKYAGKVRRLTSSGVITFTNNSKLIMGDSKSKIEYMFSQDKTLKNVYVFRQRVSSIEDDARWNKWLADSHIMDLDPIKIESIPVAPRQPRVKSAYAPRQRVKTYKWDRGEWCDTEIEGEVLEDGEGIYVPCFRRRAMTDNTCTEDIDPENFRISDILNFIKDKKLVVYGIQKDVLPTLGSGWVSLFDYVRNLIKEIATEHKIPVGTVVDFINGSKDDRSFHYAPLHKLISENIKRMPDCVVNWFNESEILNKLNSDKDFKFISGYCNYRVWEFLKLENMDKKHINTDKLKEIVYEECKLLKHIPFGNYGFDATVVEDVIVYLSAIKENKTSKKLVA